MKLTGWLNILLSTAKMEPTGLLSKSLDESRQVTFGAGWKSLEKLYKYSSKILWWKRKRVGRRPWRFHRHIDQGFTKQTANSDLLRFLHWSTRNTTTETENHLQIELSFLTVLACETRFKVRCCLGGASIDGRSLYWLTNRTADLKATTGSLQSK